MKKFDSVVFDVDSTLTKIEGLDFLAELKGKSEEMKLLTSQAMNGSLSMREAMKVKMRTISPTYNDLVKMGEAYVKNVTQGARKTVSVLKKNGIDVWIVTGNFQPGVGILANYLGIDNERVITNKIYFDKNKKYKGFDIDHPLSNNGGKVTMVKTYKRRMKRTVFVGDGNTDLETKSVVELFIGYGGVVKRPKIASMSEIYIEDSNIESILQHIFDK